MQIDKRSPLAGLHPSHNLWITILMLLSISGVAFWSHQLFLKNYAQNQLAQAKKNWTTQAVNHYRLKINYTAPDNCQQELEIKNEKVIAISQNTCTNTPPLTVTKLFQEIATLTDSQQCGPNGCACDGTMSVHATYDNKFGYPSQLEISLAPEKRWLYLNPLHSGKNCTLIGFVGKKISVSAFTPIQ
ncbi:DUF6174 domain-containing protein [Anabaena sp. 4-3]|uniref:DUF6174 domain-containing protein n=1 Tax=Anabaena sp. 4-3 TaxID=1811979 RepID=UPI00082D8F34|nr:DUF6174 domain-containing protein [Anabaena sp. 4-3]